MYTMKFIKSVPPLKGEGDSKIILDLIKNAYRESVHWWIEGVKGNKTIYVNLDNVAYIVADNAKEEEKFDEPATDAQNTQPQTEEIPPSFNPMTEPGLAGMFKNVIPPVAQNNTVVDGEVKEVDQPKDDEEKE